MTRLEYGIRQPVVSVERCGFALDRANGKIGGVCAGLARWMGINLLLVRIAFVAGSLLGFGSFMLIYGLIWLLAD